MSRWQPFLLKFCVTDTVSMGVCPQRQVSNVPLPAKPSSTGKAYYVMEARHCSCAVVACGAKRALALLNGVWGSQGRAPKGYRDLGEAVNACAVLWHTDIVHLHLPLSSMKKRGTAGAPTEDAKIELNQSDQSNQSRWKPDAQIDWIDPLALDRSKFSGSILAWIDPGLNQDSIILFMCQQIQH